jgi:DNA-binding CsgD family transcriptional regulator
MDETKDKKRQSVVLHADYSQEHSQKSIREQTPAGSVPAVHENDRKARPEGVWYSSPTSKEFAHDILWEVQHGFQDRTTPGRHTDEPDQLFIRNILARYPDLTPAELKLCCLLRMNMATKEMAQLLHISKKTVENQRYRLRRKFGLSHGRNLTSFLLTL